MAEEVAVVHDGIWESVSWLNYIATLQQILLDHQCSFLQFASMRRKKCIAALALKQLSSTPLKSTG